MKKELWLRLRKYHFDDLVPPHLADHVRSLFAGSNASTCAFASKIARKHNWTERFALRAIDEYKKFVFLGVTSDVPVTPPKIIDMVWHEHILFSRAYREFCDAVLTRPFDHNPELLPTPDQTDVFETQFEQTLDSYEREFRVPPPEDIWGTPKFKRERKISGEADSSSYTDSGTPLYMMFDSSATGGDASSMAEFGGGGGFSGGGGESSWGSDSSSTDSGSSSSDGGGSSCGSGCSSSCGGGGCSS
jgi:hypothetical protein